jgi:hypothetical protein
LGKLSSKPLLLILVPAEVAMDANPKVRIENRIKENIDFTFIVFMLRLFLLFISALRCVNVTSQWGSCHPRPPCRRCQRPSRILVSSLMRSTMDVTLAFFSYSSLKFYLYGDKNLFLGRF